MSQSAHVTTPQPTRRGVLAVIGVGALMPVAASLLRAGPEPVDVDGVRFTVLGARRRPLAPHLGSGLHAAQGSWPDVVRVGLGVVNLAATALLLSPGQFRLRVDGGLTVMPTAWRHDAGALAPGSRRTTWIDYRAPGTGGPLVLEFTPAGRPTPVAVPLPALLDGAR